MGNCCGTQTSEGAENSSEMTREKPSSSETRPPRSQSMGRDHRDNVSQGAWRPHEELPPGQGSRGASPQFQRRGVSPQQQHRKQQAQSQSSSTSYYKPLDREKEQPPALKDFNDGGASSRQHPENLTGWKYNPLPDIHKPRGKSDDSELMKQISALQLQLDTERQEYETFRKQAKERNRDLQRERDEARRENEESMKQMEKLQKENAELQARNRDLLQRISSMASERMRFNNPCVEDLSDPNRHSAVQSRWQAVMNGEYWTLYEAALRKLPSEKATSRFLLRIMELAFTETQSLVGGTGTFMNQLKTLGRNDANLAALVDALERQHEFRQIVDAEGRKLRKKVDSTLPRSAFEDFHKKIHRDQRNVGEEMLQKSRKFADQVLGLCYLMALQTPPMALVFDSPEDKEMDTLLYEPDGDRNKRKPWIVSFVLTPPLLRYEGGPILSKGTVELE